MAPSQAVIKRSLRYIQSELEFLSETNVLSQDQLASILAHLPDANNLPLQPERVGDRQAQPQVQSPTSPPAPSAAFANLNVNDAPNKNGYYSPSPNPTLGPSAVPPPPAYPMAPQPPAADALTHATALYAYKPSDSYDLELAPGDRIAVIEYMNEEWWKGRSERTRLEGIFPRNYVRVDDQIPQGKETNYGNMPVQVANEGGQAQAPSKAQEYGKKFGKKLGNAAIFGAGATIGSDLVNSIF